MSAEPNPGEPWVATFDTYSARLAGVRHVQGWNVKEAAAECGLPAASWRDWELNGRLPRNIVEVAGKIAARTGCDQAWLIGLPRLDSNQQPSVSLEPQVNGNLIEVDFTSRTARKRRLQPAAGPAQVIPLPELVKTG